MQIKPCCVVVFLAACGGGGTAEEVDAGQDARVDAAIVVSECAPGQFATGFDLDGTLRCAPITSVAADALTNHCELFMGWNDNCGACTTSPTKWGRVSGASCENGLGADNTCADTDLGGVTMPLFGLNLDGNVNEDDKFHIGFECTSPPDDTGNAPCGAGTFLTSVGSRATCASAQTAIVDYFSEGCRVYYGWRDNCDGCTSAPSKWGTTSANDCVVGAGAQNTCTSFNLDGTAVFTLGVNTEGDVNDDDKFYLGFQCTGAVASEGLSPEACPPGELVVAVEQGGVRCASPIPEAEAAVSAGCFLYFGWRDSCDGCTTAPSKWGRVGHEQCENGLGANNTCASTPLDGTSVQLLGINTDGDVNDDDKFYLGLSCPGQP